MMFDSRHVLEPLLDSEQAAALVKVHPKSRPRHARTGCVAGLGQQVLAFPSIGFRWPVAGRGAHRYRLSTRTAVLCS
jgi:hypothetical protein